MESQLANVTMLLRIDVDGGARVKQNEARNCRDGIVDRSISWGCLKGGLF